MKPVLLQDYRAAGCRGSGPGGLRRTPEGGNPDAAPSVALKGYVSIWCCWPLLSISILRGFACSATGIRSVNTPTS